MHFTVKVFFFKCFYHRNILRLTGNRKIISTAIKTKALHIIINIKHTYSFVQRVGILHT